MHCPLGARGNVICSALVLLSLYINILLYTCFFFLRRNSYVREFTENNTRHVCTTCGPPVKNITIIIVVVPAHFLFGGGVRV